MTLLIPVTFHPILHPPQEKCIQVRMRTLGIPFPPQSGHMRQLFHLNLQRFESFMNLYQTLMVEFLLTDVKNLESGLFFGGGLFCFFLTL